MRQFEANRTVSTLTNLAGASQFVTMQLSFSTADIEQSLFFEAEHAPMRVGEPLGRATILVVHGDMFAVEDTEPKPSNPLTEESGLFRIIGLGAAE